jgi:hypothetical protein
LSDVTLSTGLTSIPYLAFARCTSLTEITLPSGITLGSQCFLSSGLIGIDASNATLGMGNFQNCKNLEEIIINSGQTSIPGECFESCSSLTGVTMPSVNAIGFGSFSGCTSLVSAQFNSNTSLTVDGWSFAGCRNLTGITPNIINIAINGTNYGQSAFEGCSALTGSIIISNDIDTTQLGGKFFKDCSSLTSVTFGTNITYLSGSCFDGCSSLSEIYAYPAAQPTSYDSYQTLFLSLPNNGTFHYPSGSASSYSDWITTLQNKGWTAIGDL